MRLADGKRERAPLRGNPDAFGNRLIERVQPLVHGGLRYRDLVAFARIERAQAVDPGLQIVGLRCNLTGDFRPLAFVLDRDQTRRRSDQAIGVLGKPK